MADNSGDGLASGDKVSSVIRAKSSLLTPSFYAFGGALVAVLVLVLSQLARTAAPPSGADVPCATQPPISVSLPVMLPPAPAPGGAAASVSSTAATGLTPLAMASAATGTAGRLPATPAPVAATPQVAIRSLFRGDDPPSAHGLVITGGPLMPWVMPQPCRLTSAQRRGRPMPCVNLLPPGSGLCVSGIAGGGRLSSDAAAPLFAVQATHVTLRDTSGTLRLDLLQGYFRYDDPDRGLLLLCPQISLLERIGSNARQFSATCSNGGADGWSVSGQVTDGGLAAPDSIGLTIQAPDGRRIPLVGALPVGSVYVDDLPDEAP